MKWDNRCPFGKLKQKEALKMQIPFAPFTYAHSKALLAQMQNAYPFAQFSVFGRTVTKRGIFALTLGEGADNILFLAGLQGEDTAAPLLLYRFFARLCAAYSADKSVCSVQIRRSLQGRKITVVPCVNPDAFEIRRYGALGAGNYAGLVSRAAGDAFLNWRANARGVNIAHNFDFHHRPVLLANAADRPSPFAYGGPAPESEAETCALVRLCLRESFRHSVLLEDFGRRFFWSGAEGCFEKSDIPLTAKVLAGAADYTLSEKEEMLRHGAFSEWFSTEFHRPAFTVAAGETPLVENQKDFDKVYREIEEMLVLSAIL